MAEQVDRDKRVWVRAKCNTCTQWFDIDPETQQGACPCGATRVIWRDGKQVAQWT